jgi:mono/diheme cytochrome c family protein
MLAGPVSDEGVLKMRRVSVVVMSGFVLFAVVLLATVTSAQGRGAASAARSLKNPVASSPASITAGAAAYKKYCAFCHGADGKGNGPLAPKDSMPSDLTDAMWTHGSTDGEIFTLITAGAGANSKMIAFKGKIPDQDIWHIVNFIRSLGPKGAPR